MKRKLSTKGKIHYAIYLITMFGVLVGLPATLICIFSMSRFTVWAECFFWVDFCIFAFEAVRWYKHG